jgi:UDP-N-acetylglucosamine 2-epimerase (non-hydrolysing)
MSDAFFKDLGLPEPDLHLGVGSGTHAEQTGQVMMAYEKVLLEEKPDLVVVVGDVNSTVACALATSKIQYQPSPMSHELRSATHELSATPAPWNVAAIPLGSYELGHRPMIAHLEAGLRSFDRTMPEEINRLLTDALADILWTPSQDADENLMREGVSPKKIHRVGNIMIDSLEMLRDKIQDQAAYNEFGLEPGNYGVITLHRPSNVDDRKVLKLICHTLMRMSRKIPLIFPIHPRTRKSLEQNGLLPTLKRSPGLYTLEPLNYIRFMNLVFNCRLAITDSGGIQEETTYLGIPCLTMRPNTERPITITQGTNRLCKPQELEKKAEAILSGKTTRGNDIELWDGKTATRVVKSIRNQIKLIARSS